MGAGVAVDGGFWLAAGWVARNAAEAIIDQLEGPATDQVTERLKPILDVGFDADFRGASRDEIEALAAAARRALQQVKAQGGADWAKPSFFPGYIERFAELVALLEEAAGERSGGGEGTAESLVRWFSNGTKEARDDRRDLFE